MTKKVKKSARETSTWAGGMFCNESALLIKSKTMIILVKEVNIKIKAGAILSKVINRSTCNESATSLGPLAWVTLKSIFGTGICWAKRETARKKKTNPKKI